MLPLAPVAPPSLRVVLLWTDADAVCSCVPRQALHGNDVQGQAVPLLAPVGERQDVPGGRDSNELHLQVGEVQQAAEPVSS